MIEEANIIKHIYKTQKIFLEGAKGPIPSYHSKGVMRISNTTESENKDVSFLVMKQYQINLLDYYRTN